MKKHQLLFTIISSTFIFSSRQSTILATTQHQELFTIQNTKSPFYGKTAYRKNSSQPWYIPGDTNKTPMVAYKNKTI